MNVYDLIHLYYIQFDSQNRNEFDHELPKFLYLELTEVSESFTNLKALYRESYAFAREGFALNRETFALRIRYGIQFNQISINISSKF